MPDIVGLKATTENLLDVVDALTKTNECFGVLLEQNPERPIGDQLVKEQLLNLARETAALAALVMGDPD